MHRSQGAKRIPTRGSPTPSCSNPSRPCTIRSITTCHPGLDTTVLPPSLCTSTPGPNRQTLGLMLNPNTGCPLLQEAPLALALPLFLSLEDSSFQSALSTLKGAPPPPRQPGCTQRGSLFVEGSLPHSALSLLCPQLPPGGTGRILFWVTSGRTVKPSSSTSGHVCGDRQGVRLPATEPPSRLSLPRPLPPLGPDSGLKTVPVAVTVFPGASRGLREESTPWQ